jgi:hypothetical protein
LRTSEYAALRVLPVRLAMLAFEQPIVRNTLKAGRIYTASFNIYRTSGKTGR